MDDININELEYQALLFDFYGELLTQKQKDIYSDHICDDLTVSEIAEAQGVSRQAAHDLLKRTAKLLDGYEEKLGLVKKFLRIKEDIRQINELAENSKLDLNSRLERIKTTAEGLLEEF